MNPDQGDTAVGKELNILKRRLALEIAIGEQLLTHFELYTSLLENANLEKSLPLIQITKPTFVRTICFLEKRHQKYQKSRSKTREILVDEWTEFVQKVVDSSRKRWTRDVFNKVISDPFRRKFYLFVLLLVHPVQKNAGH